ncbi:MAG: hypothetical protein SWK76_07070 [Actinomycetota bacterium]|nr:hypothetical protein [Actinomycetota bacterium]
MSDHHEDRAPLILKVSLRQALRRVHEEAQAFSQYEKVAANLGWDDVAETASSARIVLANAAEKIADTVEAAARLQSEMAQAHTHSHTHEHEHTHSHINPHDYEHE